jgi:exosortase/archaeosortase family protein
MPDYKNVIVFLLIFALFLGATIEISEGSILLGVILFVIAILLISRIQVDKLYVIKQSKLHMFLGALIIAAGIAYNVLTNSELGTLDIMTFLLGISLIAYFDHYFVLLPSVFIINAIGIPIQVIATETVRIQGVEDMSVIIGGPCSGLYSMFLLIGIMVAYTRIEDVKRSKFFALLLISVVVAYIANLTRVTTLYIVGFYYGKEPMYFVHVHLGWIIFVIVVAVLLYVLDRMAR